MENLIGLIQSFGFPIAMCVILMWYCKYLWDKYIQSTAEMRNKYDESQKGLQEIIMNNTEAMTKLAVNISHLIADIRGEEMEERENESDVRS